MNRKLRTLSAAVLLGAALIVPASAARVEINGTALSPGQGWVEDGASRVTLLSLSQSAEYDLSWDGAAAALSGPGFTLTAAPGQEYIQVNGRFLYVPGGVQCRDGRTVLPLALLADALGCRCGSCFHVIWNQEREAAGLDQKMSEDTSASVKVAVEGLKRLIEADRKAGR